MENVGAYLSPRQDALAVALQADTDHPAKA